MASASRGSANTSLRAFTLFEGILMLVLGGLSLLFPVGTSEVITAVVAVAFLVGGIVGWVNNLMRARQLGRWLSFWRLVVSTVFLIAGITMLQQLGAGPLSAMRPVVSLALAIGIVFLVEGLVAVGVSISHRKVRGWGWGLMNGVVTLILGVLILSMKVGALLSVLGILVGVSFLFSGLDLLIFSASFHPGEPD
ncbi:MAG: DUF308 domain-containing protein [Cyanobacteriota bacterium]|nr:DUF308 domain-containing protein [Cyanobacteriota bacterium]